MIIKNVLRDIRRYFYISIVACFILVMLTACHGGGQMAEYEVPEEFDSMAPVDIVFWAKNDTNARQTAIYQKAAEDFHKIYPNVTVTIRLYNDYSKIYNDVITNIATGTTPNICITYPDHIATYLTSSNQVLELDELLYDENFGLGGKKIAFDAPTALEIEQKYLEEGMIADHYYALPYMRSTEALYINKTYVEALGYEVPDVLTWDYVWEVSEAALKTNADGSYSVNGQNIMIPFIYKSTDNMMIQRLHQMGADYTTDHGDILIFNDDTKDILLEIAEHSNTKAFSTFKISSYPANFLNAGQCIFAIDSTAGSTWMGPEAPLSDICSDDIVNGIEVVVRPIPQVDINNPSMISQGPSICVFNKENPNEVLASWMFAQYLLTDDVQINYAQTEGYIPVTTKARNNPEYLDYLSKSGEDNDKYYNIKIDATKLLLDNVDNTFITPVFNGSASVRNASGELIESVVKSVRRKQVVDDLYIASLYGDINALYRLNQIGASISGANKEMELGPLPGGAKALIISLVVVWICIAVYFVIKMTSNNKKKGLGDK